jgi:hypothetical protein
VDQRPVEVAEWGVARKLKQATRASAGAEAAHRLCRARDAPLLRPTGELPLLRTSGDLTLLRTSGDLPLLRTSSDLPLLRASGDLPLLRTSGDLPLLRTSGDLPLLRTSGDLPLLRTSGDLPLLRRSCHASLLDIAGDTPLLGRSRELPAIAATRIGDATDDRQRCAMAGEGRVQLLRVDSADGRAATADLVTPLDRRCGRRRRTRGEQKCRRPASHLRHGIGSRDSHNAQAGNVFCFTSYGS